MQPLLIEHLWIDQIKNWTCFTINYRQYEESTSIILLLVFRIIIIICISKHQVSDTAYVDTLKALTLEHVSIFRSGDTLKILSLVSTFLAGQFELMSPEGQVVIKQQVREYLLGYARTYHNDIKF